MQMMAMRNQPGGVKPGAMNKGAATPGGPINEFGGPGRVSGDPAPSIGYPINYTYGGPGGPGGGSNSGLPPAGYGWAPGPDPSGLSYAYGNGQWISPLAQGGNSPMQTPQQIGPDPYGNVPVPSGYKGAYYGQPGQTSPSGGGNPMMSQMNFPLMQMLLMGLRGGGSNPFGQTIPYGGQQPFGMSFGSDRPQYLSNQGGGGLSGLY